MMRMRLDVIIHAFHKFIIKRHHNPIHSPHDLDTHSHPTHNMNDPPTINKYNMNDSPRLNVHTPPQSYTPILNDSLTMNDTRPYRLI